MPLQYAILPFLLTALAPGAELPAGTVLTVRMVDEVHSGHHSEGQEFRATLDEPVSPGEGEAVIARGTRVQVRLAEVAEQGRLKGRPVLSLVLASIQIEGRTVDLHTYRATTSGDSRLRSTAAIVGGATAAGAVFGGGVGAIAGAGVGSAFQMARRGKSLRVPSESRLTFTLAQPLRL